MPSEQELKDLLYQVSADPGSPAYATLAEKYLQNDRLPEALRVCREGFAANPGFEHGAITYLRALRRMGDLHTASEVYGRAAALMTKSPTLMAAWAQILADAGQTREARNLINEALAIEPQHAEALSVLELLGGGTSSKELPPAPIPARRRQDPVSKTPAPRAEAPSFPPPSSVIDPGNVQKASVMPRVRPIGQRRTDHGRFDLTPTPLIVLDEKASLSASSPREVNYSEVKPISPSAISGPLSPFASEIQAISVDKSGVELSPPPEKINVKLAPEVLPDEATTEPVKKAAIGKISLIERKNLAEKSPSAEIKASLGKLPSSELKSKLNKTPSKEISPPSPHSPSAEIKPPLPRIPSAEIKPPLPRIPSAEIKPPLPRIPSADLKPSLPRIPSAEMKAPLVLEEPPLQTRQEVLNAIEELEDLSDGIVEGSAPEASIPSAELPPLLKEPPLKISLPVTFTPISTPASDAGARPKNEQSLPAVSQVSVGHYRRRSKRLGIIIGAVAAIAFIAASIIGTQIYRNHRWRQNIIASLALLEQDTPTSFAEAETKLSSLRAAHPQRRQIQVADALFQSLQLLRLGPTPALNEQIKQNHFLQNNENTPPDDNLTVARAILKLSEGKNSEAQKLLDTVSTNGRQLSFYFLAAQEAAIQNGDFNGAQAIIAQAENAKALSPALLENSAALFRWQGNLAQATALVAQGLQIAPQHLGLRLMKFQLDAESGTPPVEEIISTLEQESKVHPRYTAMVEALRFLIASHKGQWAESAKFAQTAHHLMPHHPEYAFMAAKVRSRPEGDISTGALALLASAETFGKFNPVVYLETARAALLLGRPDQAAQQMEKIVKDALTPTSLDEMQALDVQIKKASDNIPAIIAICKSAGEQSTEAPKTLITCIETLSLTGNQKVAWQLQKRLNKTAQTDTIKNYLAAVFKMAQGDSSSTLALLGKINSSAELPDETGPLFLQARALLQQGDVASAVKVLRDAFKRDARSARSRVALASALKREGQEKEAITLLESVLADKPTAPALIADAGQVLMDLGLASQAAELFSASKKKVATSSSLLLLSGRAAISAGRLEEGEKIYSSIIARDPNNIEALMELGQFYSKNKQVAKAKKLFSSAIKLRPKDPSLMMALSMTHAQSGDYKAAFNYGAQGMALYQQSNQPAQALEARIALARTLTKGDRWAQRRAEELLFQIAKRRTAPAPIFLELGRLYQQQNDLAKAVWCFRQVTERFPQIAEGYFELGMTLKNKREWRKQAKVALKQYLTMHPPAKEAARARTVLDSLK